MRQTRLPANFSWHRQAVGGVPSEVYALFLGGPHGVEVARVERRITEGWLVEVNRHLDTYGRARASSLPVGQKWVERWATAHGARLLSNAADLAARAGPQD